jgi:succinate-semialdehyde dehydrogenase/glutarate-semialdehyde dehydrogenase
MGATFESLNPATGEVVRVFPIQDAAQVQAVVDAARPAAAWWAGMGSDGRRQRLFEWRTWLAKHIRELAELMHTENGKPNDDAIFEIGVAIEHLDWAARHAGKVLGRRRPLPGLLAANHSAHVDYEPFGVVGVLGPWNYPVHTPMGSISYALAAGNAVVFKPSEYTPAVGRWLVDSFARIVPEHPVFSLVTGLGDTGQALCRSGVDKVAFTGSTTTGKKVMATCAESLTPVVIECGGKDALIVAADADVSAAAEAAVWGGMSNAGQTCIGIERVYAVDSVYDAFLAEVVARASKLRAGEDRNADIGPITMPSQIDVIARHIADALACGGRAVVGGPESVRAPFVDPVVLVDVPFDAAAEQEETFGPTLTVSRVRDIDEAVSRANGTSFGLGAAVYSAKHGREIAARIKAGMVSINSVITFAAVPSMPFGGVGASGFGRIHGPDGLREFAWPRATTKTRFPGPINLQTFDRRPAAIKNLVTMVQSVWGR